MSKITDILGLEAEATEDVQVSAIGKIIHDRNTGNSAARVTGSVSELKKIARAVGIEVPDNVNTDEDARAELRIMIKQAYEAKAKPTTKGGKPADTPVDDDEDGAKVALESQQKQEAATIRFMLKQKVTLDKKIKADCIEDALDKLDSKKVKVAKDKDGTVVDVTISDEAYAGLQGTRPSYFEAESEDKTKVGANSTETKPTDVVKFATEQAERVSFNN